MQLQPRSPSSRPIQRFPRRATLNVGLGISEQTTRNHISTHPGCPRAYLVASI